MDKYKYLGIILDEYLDFNITATVLSLRQLIAAGMRATLYGRYRRKRFGIGKIEVDLTLTNKHNTIYWPDRIFPTFFNANLIL